MTKYRLKLKENKYDLDGELLFKKGDTIAGQLIEWNEVYYLIGNIIDMYEGRFQPEWLLEVDPTELIKATETSFVKG